MLNITNVNSYFMVAAPGVMYMQIIFMYINMFKAINVPPL